jgi:hypothetical protein
MLLLTASLLDGCASIMNKSLVEVPVDTNPPEAKVMVGGQEIKSPGKLQLARGKGDYQVKIEKEGYETANLVLKESWDAWMWGNILLGGLLGLTIDLVTRYGYDLEPEEIRYDLVKKTVGGQSKDQLTLSSTAPMIPASDVDRPPTAKVTMRKNAHAIVIGIEHYQQLLPKADFASHDAEIMGQYLTKTLGYPEENIVVLLNDRATKTYIEKYVEGWLPGRVESGDSVFIYYSGHGAPNPKTGKGYLVPYDGDPAFVEQTGYPLDRLYERLAALPVKEVVVMLDSCFSGAGGRSVIAEGMRPMILSVENPVLAKGKVVVLTASSGTQASSTYKQKGHGLLTYFFLKGLQGEADGNQDGRIDLSEAFDYLKPQVERTARREFNNQQTPQLLGSPDVLTHGVVLVGASTH